MVTFIKTEPVYFYGLIQVLIVAILNLVLAFGVTVTVDQVAAINGFLLGFTTLVLALITHAKVVPTAKLPPQ